VIARCITLCFAVALVFAQAPAARRFSIPGHGELVLQVPEGWKGDIRQPPENLPPTFTFSPSFGAPFRVMVTAGGFAKPGAPVMDADTLRKRVEAIAKGAEPQAAEKSLEVKELVGSACHGFYFSATDKAPKPGEYAYMTQGIARAGDILLAFTVLTHDGQEAVVKAALEMVRRAVLHPGRAMGDGG
jgi:hypothetical protein